MKSLFIIITTFLFACNSSSVKEQISGTYINEADGQFSKAINQLVIEAVGNHSNSYVVHYLSEYQRKKDGVLQPKKERLEKTMTFFFNAEKEQLEEPGTGKTIV
jgi:hypothetical protein